jgi:predicted deacylase
MTGNHRIEVSIPDIARWRTGNVGTEYVHVLESGHAGPTVMVNALTHGNEVSGAIAIDELLTRGLRPRRGTLILSFANVAAFARFNPAEPGSSRFVDEDFNRVWGRLDAGPDSTEMKRARALRPFVDRADLLLDLHSMHDHSAPLMLAGPLKKGLALARQVGAPEHIVRDEGHPSGRRMRDYGGFGDPASPKNALLIETGQHWEKAAERVAKDVTARFLAATGACDATDLPPDWRQPAVMPQKVVEVTHAIATRNGNFRFAQKVAGLDVIARAGSVLGHDDERIITTPYDDCVLIMPTLRQAKPGVTVVRLGRFAA